MIRRLAFLPLISVSLWASPVRADSVLVSEKVTEYRYNADGALVSATVTESDTSATTTLTWDNYNPSTGEVKEANGNLIHVGSNDTSRSYAFDARDRLIEAEAGGQTARYVYDPASMMAVSTFNGMESYRFYYDQSRNAQAVSIVQARSAYGPVTLSSARLSGSRYLSDGDEQMLVRHRKDVGGTYDPAQGSFAGYEYDPYGAPETEPSFGVSPSYDLHDNPFQYAGEYQDPLTGNYYLRARVYDPTLQVFLSRDPVANLARYGYGHGNPVANIDPSGRRAQPYLQRLGRKGPLGYFEAGVLSGVTLGVMPLIETGRAEGARRFFTGPESWRNYLTMLMTAGAVSTLAPIIPIVGVGQTALMITTHPRHWQDYLAGLAGGFAGGMASGAVINGAGYVYGYGRASVNVPDTRLDFDIDKEAFISRAVRASGRDSSLQEGEVDLYIVRRKLNRVDAATSMFGYELAHYQIVLVSRVDVALIGLTKSAFEQDFGLTAMRPNLDGLLGRALGDPELAANAVSATFRLVEDQEWPGPVARHEGVLDTPYRDYDAPAHSIANRVVTADYQRSVVEFDTSIRNRRGEFQWYSLHRGQQCQSWSRIVADNLLNTY